MAIVKKLVLKSFADSRLASKRKMHPQGFTISFDDSNMSSEFKNTIKELEVGGFIRDASKQEIARAEKQGNYALEKAKAPRKIQKKIEKSE